MSKPKVHKVTARGTALLKLIAAAMETPAKGLYLTQAEAADEIAAGNAVADTTALQGERALVTLTAAGQASLVPAVSAEIDDDVPMPAKKTGGAKRGSKYPFDSLTKVGQSFHVAATTDNPDPLTALASSLTGARRRYAVPVTDDSGAAVNETVKVKTYSLDAKGKRVKGTDGKWVVTGETEVTRPKMKQERDFVAAAVDANDKRGVGARVYRTL